MVIATHSNGIYSAHINKVTDVNGIKEITKADPGFNFINYPNPFNTATTLQFNLKEAGHVSLNIFDVAGKPVKTIADEVMNAGEKKYTFEANLLPPGIYYCTLKQGMFTETKRLLKQ